MTSNAILSIAASDSFAAAGIQADIKTAQALGAYCATAVTAVTAQNSFGVDAIFPVPPSVLAAQLSAIHSGLATRLPSGPLTAIKIGMLGGEGAFDTVLDYLQSQTDGVPVVLDTVFGSSSGTQLFPIELLPSFIRSFLPLATVVTPNLDEAALLLGQPLAASLEEMVGQAHALMKLGAQAVLLKGGHLEGAEAVDVLASARGVAVYVCAAIKTPNSRGTGCTLSTALAVGLGQGQSLEDAVLSAKTYVSGALEGGAEWNLVNGNGPLNHQTHSGAGVKVQRRDWPGRVIGQLQE